MSAVRRTAVGTPAPAPEVGDPGQRAGRADKIEITVNGVPIAVSPELEEAVHRVYKGLLQPLPMEMTPNQDSRPAARIPS